MSGAGCLKIGTSRSKKEGRSRIISLDFTKIDKEEAQKTLEEMTLRFNNAESSKEKIEATQALRKARARVQAAML
jgi:uncharacterized lipoprotein YehR (DUF1307 family)